MRFPKLLQKGDTIGVCAPSAGVDGEDEIGQARMNNAHIKMRELGYKSFETPSVRNDVKFVSADAKTRAFEFMSLYENPDVAVIMPPWGGQFLMDMLPHLDFSRLVDLPPKWICGYSDITGLTFPLTLRCDLATIHGSQFIDMGLAVVDLTVFEAMSNNEIIQRSSDSFVYFDETQKTETTVWKALDGKESHTFEGRMIGGCMDVLCNLIGTRFTPVPDFLDKYKNDGFIWTLESNELWTGKIYRTLWQMRENGWFEYCNGIVLGRPGNLADDDDFPDDFTLLDALNSGLADLSIPVIYDADIGHTTPRIQVINGAYGKVEYHNGKAVVTQQQR
jgi:muramoyltetrapeptide carboxypeptidase LdcA involved in peptidoglycan recycling